MEDRARQALYLQTLEPIAETLADRNSYGFRPKRRCADAIDQCFKVLSQKDSATWILEGDIQGFFDHIAFPWIEEHIPMNKRLLAKWLRCGFSDRGTLYPTTAGVPQGGLISPVISNRVLDGLEQCGLRLRCASDAGTTSTTCAGPTTLSSQPIRGRSTDVDLPDQTPF